VTSSWFFIHRLSQWCMVQQTSDKHLILFVYLISLFNNDFNSSNYTVLDDKMNSKENVHSEIWGFIPPCVRTDLYTYYAISGSHWYQYIHRSFIIVIELLQAVSFLTVSPTLTLEGQNIICFIQGLSAYHAVNTLHFSYTKPVC